MTLENRVIPMEHERRFYPDMAKLPFDFKQFPATHIIQCYLEGEIKTRFRSERDLCDGGHLYTKTIKCGSGVSRFEDETEITKAQFRQAWKLARRCSVFKTRYFISFEGINLQLNIFHGKLGKINYVQIEVEFDSHEEVVAFVPPNWFGAEVTHDQCHSNYSLAKFGSPWE